MAILQDSLNAAPTTPVEPAASSAAPAPAQGGDGSLPPPNPEITNEAVASHMPELTKMRQSMPDEVGQTYDKVFIAAKRMLYSPDNAEMVDNFISDKSLPTENKLGEGVANLMVMMANESNGAIPQQILIPVGIATMFEAADYMSEIGIQIDDQVLSKALELLVYGIFSAYGAKAEQVDQVLDQMGAELGFEDAEGGAGESPAEEAAEAPEQGGPDEEDAAFQAAFNKQRGM